MYLINRPIIQFDHQLKFPTASKEEDDETTHPTLYLPTAGSLIEWWPQSNFQKIKQTNKLQVFSLSLSLSGFVDLDKLIRERLPIADVKESIQPQDSWNWFFSPVLEMGRSLSSQLHQMSFISVESFMWTLWRNRARNWWVHIYIHTTWYCWTIADHQTFLKYGI